MAKKKNTKIIVQYLNQELGFFGAVSVLEFIAQWGIAMKELGREPVNIEEYADHWKISRSQAYRDQKAFRKALLPWFKTPTPIILELRSEYPKLFDQDPGLVALRLGGLL